MSAPSIDERIAALSAAIPARIRAKVAYKNWLKTQEWRLSNANESNAPIDRNTPFYFEGVYYNPAVDFEPRKA